MAAAGEPGALVEPIANYAADYGTVLAAINQKIAPRWVSGQHGRRR